MYLGDVAHILSFVGENGINLAFKGTIAPVCINDSLCYGMLSKKAGMCSYILHHANSTHTLKNAPTCRIWQSKKSRQKNDNSKPHYVVRMLDL